MIVLNLFRCCAIGVPFVFFRLNNFFIKYTLLFADGFSYMLEKAFIKSTMVFSFTILCTIDLGRINRITLNTCLSRRFQSSSFIVSSFVPKEADAIFSHRDNLQSAPSNTQSLFLQTSQFLKPCLLLWPLLPL